jgi:hypothetical protein
MQFGKGNCVNLGNRDLKMNANGNIRYKPVRPPFWGEMNGEIKFSERVSFVTFL